MPFGGLITGGFKSAKDYSISKSIGRKNLEKQIFGGIAEGSLQPVYGTALFTASSVPLANEMMEVKN